MSFHWDLSSDEEETEEWLGKLAENPKPAAITPLGDAAPWNHQSDSNVARMPSNSDAEGFDFSDEEDDEVDWEDADDEGEMQDTKMPAQDIKMPATNVVTPKPVTIDMNKSTASEPQRKKRKQSAGRKRYRFASLPSHLQSLLVQVRKSHLLTLSSRAIQLSRCCSDVELLHVANSLIPIAEQNDSSIGEVPSEFEVRHFVSWYTAFVNNVSQRRLIIRAANEAAGAPVMRKPKKRRAPPLDKDRLGSVKSDHLLQVASYLSSMNDEHPDLSTEEMELSNQDKVQLLVAMARSMRWRARCVSALDPCVMDLDVEHPLFLMNKVGDVFRAPSKRSDNATDMEAKMPTKRQETEFAKGRELAWVEILCSRKPASSNSCTSISKLQKYRWMYVDPGRNLVDHPNAVEGLLKSVVQGGKGSRKGTIAYALAVEHFLLDTDSDDETYQARVTDVTPRYANSWSQSLLLRNAKTSRTTDDAENEWWTETLKSVNHFHQCPRGEPRHKTSGTSSIDAIEIGFSSEDDEGKTELLHSNEVIEREEKEELHDSAQHEAIPTSKAAFNNHPVYAIASVLKTNEVFAPDAKTRICGIFKGTPVYRRSDVHTALTSKKWLYQERRVRDEEIAKPVKRVKARKRPTSKGFQPLRSYGVGDGNDGSEEARQRDIAKGSELEEANDGVQNLYAHWQTMPWSPDPVGPNDPIPVNEYNNIELALINPGLVHLDQHGTSRVAKKLGIAYAPCLLGFEGHGGNRTPSIRGIVVHEHNAEVVREAHMEFMSSQLEKEHEKRAERIRDRWNRLIVGVLTKERIEREYGEE